MGNASSQKIVGNAVPRTDAVEKTTGRAVYTTDVVLPGMLHAKVLRSPYTHARICSIDAKRARSIPGVHAVVTCLDPEAASVAKYGYFIKDRPILATGKVRYEGEIVAAAAADSEELAIAALALVDVVYEALPPVTSIEGALVVDAVELFEDAPLGSVPHYGSGASGLLWPKKNVCFQFNYTTGDPAAFAACDYVFEDEFRFSRMHHFMLEPFVSVARATSSGFEIWTSSHTPFPLRKELARIFHVPENTISVQAPYVGGSFGAKSSCRTEHISMLLAMITRRPVRLCFSLEEGFRTSAQHSALLRLRTGVQRDGTLIARQSEIWLDSGAYSDASPLVAEKAGYRIPGPYRYRFIDTRCYCVMTNSVPAGAFRGFGASQTTWASESQIDMIAHRLRLDPLDMRCRNLIRLGEPFVPGESGVDSDMREGLELVARRVGYRDRKRVANRGVGLAIGFKDGGGVGKPAQARIKVSTNGAVFLQCGTIEIGQGARTALSQIVAEILGTSLDQVRYVDLHTDYVPFDQGTNASSGISVMGQAVAQAAIKIRTQVLDFAAQQLGCLANDLSLEAWQARRGNDIHPLADLIGRHFGGTGIEFTADGYFRAPASRDAPLEAKCVFWEIGWAAAEVEVDPETGRVVVDKLVVSGDAGRAIHPLTCRGQDEGAAVMGLGQALFEEIVYDGGHLSNGEALDYRVPLAEDLPREFVSILQEQGHGPGPFGAKGMGEGGMLPVASAIANAIHDAVGVRIQELPITAERVLAALEAARAKQGKNESLGAIQH